MKVSLISLAGLGMGGLVGCGVFGIGEVVWAISSDDEPALSQQAVEPLRVSPLTGFDHTIAGERR
jgi:hypothetical protein